MPYTYHRTVRFSDTDAAGVVFFANILTMCHEAYEASLAAAGVNVNAFFSYPRIAIPITHSTIDFSRPLFCGDEVRIYVTPKQLKESEFEVAYDVFSVETTSEAVTSVQEFAAARAFTKHVCIDSATRGRTNLPEDVTQWLIQWGKPLGNPIELL